MTFFKPRRRFDLGLFTRVPPLRYLILLFNYVFFKIDIVQSISLSLKKEQSEHDRNGLHNVRLNNLKNCRPIQWAMSNIHLGRSSITLCCRPNKSNPSVIKDNKRSKDAPRNRVRRIQQIRRVTNSIRRPDHTLLRPRLGTDRQSRATATVVGGVCRF